MPHIPNKTAILLAEDEVRVRNLIQLMLCKAGYVVLAAADGEEALTLCKHFGHPIELLITDVSMPKMDGHVLREAVRLQRPDIKVVVISGAMDKAILAANKPDAFLSKPFIPPTLLKTIQQVLDGEVAPVAEV